MSPTTLALSRHHCQGLKLVVLRLVRWLLGSLVPVRQLWSLATPVDQMVDPREECFRPNEGQLV